MGSYNRNGSRRVEDITAPDEGDGYTQYVHKVRVPPKQRPFGEIEYLAKETFFHGTSLGGFKGQPIWKKLLLGLESIFPIIQWGRRYKFHMLRGDLIGGLTIASLAVPQDLGYAQLVNLEPQFGLYCSFVPPLIYALLGSSRDIAIGPVAVVSILLGTLCQKEIDPTNKIEYERLVFTATFFSGLTQFVLGFFRLGFLIDYLSHASVVGFMAGTAITIALQQMKGLFGIKNFTKKTNIESVLGCVFSNAKHGWHWETIAIGLSFLIFLLCCKFLAKKNKIFFWFSAVAPLLSVITATFFVYITHADRRGVPIVGHIKRGINPSSLNEIFFTGQYLGTGFKIGVVAGLIALMEGVAIGRTFAALKDYNVDGNREMVAFGAMNILGSITSCYTATGSFSRSSVNYMAGCHTPLTNIVMAFIIFLTLEVITPLFRYTPNAILASVIIAAVVGLIDIPAMIHIWKIDKLDFMACMGAFFGVLFASVEIGILVAVIISFLKIVLQVTRPRILLVGKIPRTNVYRNIGQYPEASRVAGFVIVRVNSPIYFSNSNFVREKILKHLADEEEQFTEKIQYLIIEMSSVTDIDTTGINAMEDVYKILERREIQLALANPGQVVLEKLHACKFIPKIGEDNVFLTVADAVMTLEPKQQP